MRQAAHAVGLILADFVAFLGRHENHRVVRRLERIGEALRHPGPRAVAVLGRDPEVLALHAHVELHGALARLDPRIGYLPLRPVFQAAQERVAHRRAVEAGGREAVQQDVARFQRAQPVLPLLGDRAFMRQQRPGAELERDRAQLRIVDPVVPFTQEPHPARHHDRHVVRNAFGAHRLAQQLHPGIGVFGLGGVFRVGKAVMPAGKPRVFIDHRRHQLGHLVVGPPPPCAEGARGADDREVVDVEALRDLGQLVRHAGAAGDARHQAARLFQHAFQHGLRPAHFPQHVDVDRAPVAGDVVSPLHLLHRAVDGVADQLLVPLLAGELFVDLRDDLAFGIIRIGVDGAHRPDAAGRGPRAGTGVVRRRNALAAFDQRPDLAAAIADRT